MKPGASFAAPEREIRARASSARPARPSCEPATPGIEHDACSDTAGTAPSIAASLGTGPSPRRVSISSVRSDPSQVALVPVRIAR